MFSKFCRALLGSCRFRNRQTSLHQLKSIIGRHSARDYLDSRPIAAEAEAISRALLFAAETGCKLHVVHTSSVRGARLVREALAAGRCDASCETCPHYLLLSAEDVLRMGARAKCAPPLRSEAERLALVQEVISGGVDTIGSDHSPSPASMKNAPDFFGVWGGISGVQTTLRALLTLNVPGERIAQLTAENVARRFSLPGKGDIRLGGDADLALVDMATTAPLAESELLDKHHLSPYVGRPLRGTIRRTMVRGQTVFLDGALVGPARGVFLRPAEVSARSPR